MITTLNLPDFDQITPESLDTQIVQAIEALKDFLSGLSETIDETRSAEAALDLVFELEALELNLERPYGLMSHLNSVNGSSDYRELRARMQPMVSELTTQLGQHEGLYRIFNQIKQDQPFFEGLPKDRKRSIDKSLKSFTLLGFGLEQSKRTEFGQIQTQLSKLSSQFSEQVLDATQSYARALSTSEIKGVPTARLDLLRAAATDHKLDSEFAASLSVPVYVTLMTYSEDRALREELYHAYGSRASSGFVPAPHLDNGPVMAQILKLRHDKAQLLGFDHFADLSLELKMATDTNQVEDFLEDLAVRARPFAEQDLAEAQAFAQTLGIDQLEPWDLAFVSDKLKSERFSFDSEAVRSYFTFEKVLSGLFTIAERLFDIQIKPDTAPVWHPDVRFFKVLEDDQPIGAFYLDPFSRSGKRGGAWMNGFDSRFTRAGELNLPVAFLVCNFAPPSAGADACLTHSEVTTLFHEFGHGLHHLLTKVGAPGVSGINGVEWDAVELPSQLMENWAWDAEGIRLISAHETSGESLPADLLEAMLSARHFQSGLQALRQVEFALFDLRLHQQGPVTEEQIDELMSEVRSQVSVLKIPPSNRFAHSFSHVFAGGYAAGYYSYKWAELLAFDAFERFEEEGVFSRAVGTDLKNAILSRGGSGSASEHFMAFRGRAPRLDALLRHSGWAVGTAEISHAP